MIYSIFVLSAILYAAESAKFPPNWTKCPKTDNAECVKEAVQVALRDMSNGKKEVNVVPLDPLHFDRMELNQGDNSPVAINLTFYDLDMLGVSRVVVRSAKVDWDNYNIDLDVFIEGGPAQLLGDYTIGGKVLVLPIRGQGKANITLEDLSVLIKFKGSEMVKNNKKYMRVDDCKFIMSSPRVHFWFGNLFDGVPNLGDNMNTFLNENWREIMSELNGTISSGVGLGLKHVANGLFRKFPVTDLHT